MHKRTQTNPAERFIPLERLGEGSFGEVFKAKDTQTNEIVAIKVIDLEESEDDIAAIRDEITMLSACDSPQIVRYISSAILGHKLWIVMEYLGGGSVLDLLKPGVLEERYISVIIRETLLGLDYMHANSKIHRDIKAANVLVSTDGRVKLADFGVAVKLTDTMSKRNTFVGTPYWMAPEVIKQAKYDCKADIWSLGITAMEMAMGAPPRSNQHPMKALLAIPREPPPALDESRTTYTAEFKAFLEQCLQMNPRKRPSTCELLQHPFVTKAAPVEVLVEVIDRLHIFQSQAADGKVPGPARRHGGDAISSAIGSSSAMDKHEDVDWTFDTVKPVRNIRVPDGPVPSDHHQVLPSNEAARPQQPITSQSLPQLPRRPTSAAVPSQPPSSNPARPAAVPTSPLAMRSDAIRTRFAAAGATNEQPAALSKTPLAAPKAVPMSTGQRVLAPAVRAEGAPSSQATANQQAPLVQLSANSVQPAAPSPPTPRRVDIPRVKMVPLATNDAIGPMPESPRVSLTALRASNGFSQQAAGVPAVTQSQSTAQPPSQPRVTIVAAQSAPTTPNQAAAVQSPQPLAPASSASAAKHPTAPLRVDVPPTGTNGSAAGAGAGAASANRVQDSQRVAAPARNPPPTNERPPAKSATATPAKVQLFPQLSKDEPPMRLPVKANEMPARRHTRSASCDSAQPYPATPAIPTARPTLVAGDTDCLPPSTSTRTAALPQAEGTLAPPGSMERRAPQAELPAKALPAKDAGKAKSEITKGAVASGSASSAVPACGNVLEKRSADGAKEHVSAMRGQAALQLVLEQMSVGESVELSKSIEALQGRLTIIDKQRPGFLDEMVARLRGEKLCPENTRKRSPKSQELLEKWIARSNFEQQAVFNHTSK